MDATLRHSIAGQCVFHQENGKACGMSTGFLLDWPLQTTAKHTKCHSIFSLKI